MHTELGLNTELRARLLPNNRLTGRANVLIYGSAG
ncbi:hypothetical protein PVW51_14325 [Sulfitobacter sp. PR48]|nr:hypothetical protein [Sulfitobacter sp. PR48]MDD9721879.1 hypothetical protein [Sulfitobacter sp. PR48]